jgi:hypothetical protein
MPSTIQRQRLPVVESVLLMLITLALSVGLRLPTLWFLIPFAVITLTRRPYEPYGLSLRKPGSVRLHACICLVVYGGYALAHYGFAHLYLGRELKPALPPNFGRLLLEQLLLVGLPEEFFFRGYLQTQLNRALGRPYQLLGARWGMGLPIAALLFGLCHLIDGDVTRLRVVLFGLFAGWLRERTDTILVPAAYHGLSNVLYETMQRSLVVPN